MLNVNDILASGESVLRIIKAYDESVLVVDCVKQRMPFTVLRSDLTAYETVDEVFLLSRTQTTVKAIGALSARERAVMHKRFTLIASLLSVLDDDAARNYMINQIALHNHISKQTIKKYLWKYLVYNDVAILSTERERREKQLTKDEKNMRWALNKYYYNQNHNTLTTAYTLLLKAKYTDENGALSEHHVSMHQFRYFYKKYNKKQTEIISRNGIKDYQKNHRLLLGNSIRDYCSQVGYGLIDATVTDIYLVDEAGRNIGRAVLTACVDGYSGVCMGYAIGLEGGVSSLREMLVNVVSDKKEHCRKFGIEISDTDWNCHSLPGTLVTDRGREYVGSVLEQISELGVTIVNLDSFRADLKGYVEKFFDCVQQYYKKHLHGKGVVERDFQERGAHDYRKDACLTLADFEKIIIRCILYYNTQRVVENFEYTDEMLDEMIAPHAQDIYSYAVEKRLCNLIDVSAEQIYLSLLMRVKARFSRRGLIVNNLRYYRSGYVEECLREEECTVAFDVSDVSCVWLCKDGDFIRFDLIEVQYKNMSLGSVNERKQRIARLCKDAQNENLEAQISLAHHIEVIAAGKDSGGKTSIKGIAENRKRAMKGRKK